MRSDPCAIKPASLTYPNASPSPATNAPFHRPRAPTPTAITIGSAPRSAVARPRFSFIADTLAGAEEARFYASWSRSCRIGDVMRIRLKPLDEQVIVIVGASSGIGLATARLAASRGARLVLAGRSELALRQLAD